MPLWEVYAEAAKDFDKRVKNVTNKAKKNSVKIPSSF
ncbi:Uncharacterised protein [Legionella sainthelensi]|nr:Uncharacterised protein [Legionella sainthelensi]